MTILSSLTIKPYITESFVPVVPEGFTDGGQLSRWFVISSEAG